MLQAARLPILLMIWVAMIFCTPSFASVDDSAEKVAWGYKGHLGPEFWGRLSPAFTLCSRGNMQSPIDIARNDMVVPNTLVLHYQPASLAVIDDGVTALLIGHHQTIFNDGHTVQVNFHVNKVNEVISYQGNRYRLLQFHFHSPSESQLNGESAPLELHFVHQGKGGRVVVIGVLVKGGAANRELQIIIDHLPKVKGKEYVFEHDKINPRELFPMDNDYYSFPGSLTTPPCTEGLDWIVMAGTITASPAQIATIRSAAGGANARSVQPLNHRTIAYAMEKRS